MNEETDRGPTGFRTETSSAFQTADGKDVGGIVKVRGTI